MLIRPVRYLSIARLGLCVLLLLLAACDGAQTAARSQGPRVVALDWGQAQTLTAMGVPPVAAAQIAEYNSWVGTPKLPPSTRDVGLRSQPNLELLAQLDPDLITITSMYAGLEPLLSRIAPVEVIDVYFGGRPVWQATVAATRALGRAVAQPEAAEQLIEQTRNRIDAVARQLPDDVPPLLIVQFRDARHVRVYGKGSLIDATVSRLGLTNAWNGPTTMWGAALVPLARLAQIESARVVVVRPIPVGVADALEDNRIWQHLPAVQNRRVLFIPGVWSYGGLPSASRFAELIGAAIEQSQSGSNARTGGSAA